jgi:hypothetical protein
LGWQKVVCTHMQFFGTESGSNPDPDQGILCQKKKNSFKTAILVHLTPTKDFQAPGEASSPT